MKKDITTGTLTNILTQATESELHKTLRDNREALLDPDKPFAALLRETMAQRGWSQTALYTRAGLSKGTLDKYLRGERLPRSRDTVLRLCVTNHFIYRPERREMAEDAAAMSTSTKNSRPMTAPRTPMLWNTFCRVLNRRPGPLSLICATLSSSPASI